MKQLFPLIIMAMTCLFLTACGNDSGPSNSEVKEALLKSLESHIGKEQAEAQLGKLKVQSCYQTKFQQDDDSIWGGRIEFQCFAIKSHEIQAKYAERDKSDKKVTIDQPAIVVMYKELNDKKKSEWRVGNLLAEQN